MVSKWYERSYRRNLIDMHIADWDDRFLSEFDSAAYADLLEKADVDTAIIYAGSCLGICYWPTKVGHMHNGLKGRDILAEVIRECRNRKMNVVVYFNIWSRWAYDHYPDWRMLNLEGKGTVETGIRYGLCCPNTPYRNYVEEQIKDLCTHYDFDGMWIDMIGWFGKVCYCPHCKDRFLRETGEPIPELVYWDDQRWVAFQRKREEWQAEFAAMITHTTKQIKPEAAIVHQCTSWLHGWSGGASSAFFEQSEYLAGDFLSDPIEQSLICKFLNALSNHKPIEFMTSRCPDLTDHTTLKSKELLEAQVYSAIANNASFLFIDAIDPVGTLNPEVYERMREIFQKTKVYETYMDPQATPVCDVGVYVNFDSMINLQDNGKSPEQASHRVEAVKRLFNITHTFIQHNIPFGIVTGKSLSELAQYQVVVLPDLIMLSGEEVEALKQYAATGGSIYASKNTSLLSNDGVFNGDFLLSDLFGVSRLGETSEQLTYMAPMDRMKRLFPTYSGKYPMMISGSQTQVSAFAGTEVWATMTLPYTDPKDIHRFSSAISNPPGPDAELPSVVFNSYGQGKVVYAAGDLEAMEQDPHRTVFANIIRKLYSRPEKWASDAPKPVEITVFRQASRQRYVIHAVNFQRELPNIPVEGMNIKLLLDGIQPLRLLSLPDETEMDFELRDGYLQFMAPRLDTYLQFALDYNSED